MSWHGTALPANRSLRLAAFAPACLLSACMATAERPDPPRFDAASGFSAPLILAPPGALDTGHWWRHVVGADIAAAVQDALATSAALNAADGDVQAALARLEQARANRGPRVDLGADIGRQKTSGNDAIDTRSIGVDGNVPIDVSGALRLREEAAAESVNAERAEAAQLRSDLARDYLLAVVDAGEATQRLALLTRQIEASRTLLRLIELRFTQGLASSVDVLQQRDELAALRQQLPSARLDQISATNRLRVVASRPPGSDTKAPVGDLPTVQAGFAAVQPIDLLQRRPALRAAAARVAAADARFAAALADQLPTLTLSGSLITRAISGDVTTLVSAALDAAFTLFDSGLDEAIADETRAVLYRLGQDYLAQWIELAVATDDLINEEASLRDRIELSQQRLETAEALLDAAQRRYERGVSDYLPVLAALRGLQQQQRDHLALRAALGRTRIRLHHALGDAPAAENA